jgi:hypothetical protein
MKPKRNPRYLAWIRTQPCLVCGSRGGIEAAHTGPRGLGQKSPDTSAIPLCPKHHRTGRDSYHRLGPRQFARVHQLDVESAVRRLTTKPVIRVECGIFVAHLDGQHYVVGTVQAGLPKAVRQALQICREHLEIQESVS